MTKPHKGGSDFAGDVLGTLGLMLNLAAIISLALWLSTVGSASGSAMLAGTLTIVLFAVSIMCFAAEKPMAESDPTSAR